MLINTNAWYGCEELKSRSTKRVCIATNFATRIRSCRADVQGTFGCEQKALLFTAFKDLLVLLDLERSKKVDLGMYRFQGPIRSLSLEGKGLRRTPIEVITIIYLVDESLIYLHQPSSEVNHRPPSVTVTSPDKSQIMKLVQNFMLFLPVPLASSLCSEGVHTFMKSVFTPSTRSCVWINFVAWGWDKVHGCTYLSCT